MTARFGRRVVLAAMGGVLAWALAGCSMIPGAKAETNTEKWLRSRPWIESYRVTRTEGWGPVPIPDPLRVFARVHTVPGTDRRALPAIAQEIEEFVAEQSYHVHALRLDLDFDTGRLPLSNDQAENAVHFAELDRATEPRAERIELVGERDRLTVTVTTRPGAVLAYAAWLTDQPHAPSPPEVMVRDAEDTTRIRTAFGHAARVRSLEEVVNTAGSYAQVRGFRAVTTAKTPELELELGRRDDLAPVFRTLRSRWPEPSLALTVVADRLGVRGATGALERLGAATTLIDSAAFARILVVEVDEAGLSATVSDATAIAQAAAAIGAHPEATGDGRAWLTLDNSWHLRLSGIPVDVADCGGPAQAVMNSPGQRPPSATSQDRALRLDPALGLDDFPAMARAMRTGGWNGTLQMTINQGLFSVTYTSTATGRAQDVTVHRSVGMVTADDWISAWDATATE